MKKFNQKGLAHLGLLLLLVGVVAVAGVSYKMVKDRNSASGTTASSTTTTSSSAQVIPTIKNTADLNTVETTLNNQNIDGNLNPDSLSQDVSSLL